MVQIVGDRVPESHQGKESRFHQANANLDLAVLGGGLNTGMMAPTCSLLGGRLNTETMVAVPLALALKCTTQSFHVCLWCLLSCRPSTRAQGEGLRANESVQRSFKRTSGFLAGFHLTLMGGILADFHFTLMGGILTYFQNQILWGHLF